MCPWEHDFLIIWNFKTLMFCSILETMVLSCNWFFRRGVIMMAVSKWSLIHLAMGYRRESEERTEIFRQEDKAAWSLRNISTDSLIEQYNSLQPKAIHLPILLGLFSQKFTSTGLFHLDVLGLLNSPHRSHITLMNTSAIPCTCRDATGSLCQRQQTETISAGEHLIHQGSELITHTSTEHWSDAGWWTLALLFKGMIPLPCA